MSDEPEKRLTLLRDEADKLAEERRLNLYLGAKLRLSESEAAGLRQLAAPPLGFVDDELRRKATKALESLWRLTRVSHSILHVDDAKQDQRRVLLRLMIDQFLGRGVEFDDPT